MASGRRRKGSMEGLDDLVRRVYPAPEQLPAVRLFRWWYRAVPERVARRARPVRLRKGELLVHVTSSTWAHELSFLKEDLVQRCQRAAPEARLRDIRFKVGSLPPRPRHQAYEPRRELPPLDPAEVARLPADVARALAHIDDDRVREIVARAASVSLTKRGR
ncbi:MAG: DciA family protein [Myxococcota bacterium]